jgi:hypothetical protein
MGVPVQPFEASPNELESRIDEYVDSFVASLQSFFVVMPKGNGFVAFARFREAYETLKRVTDGFSHFSRTSVLAALREDSLVLVVLRTMLGFTPPEFAHMATVVTHVDVDQSSARRWDKAARDGKRLLPAANRKTEEHVEALVETAVRLISEGAPPVGDPVIHRLDKIDTIRGLDSIKRVAEEGLPYEALLYERLLGRPFASHRDSVSERVGDTLEEAIKARFDVAGIAYHQAGVGERFEDMDQAPDFLIPSQVNPVVVVEAKLAEDDGTARDKVTRVQHLAELRGERLRLGRPAFEVIARVDGRGFGIRREDVKKLLRATAGKLFTLATMDSLIDNTILKTLQR